MHTSMINSKGRIVAANLISHLNVASKNGQVLKTSPRADATLPSDNTVTDHGVAANDTTSVRGNGNTSEYELILHHSTTYSTSE